MSELKSAIAYFEDAIRESDEIIKDCSPALQADLTEQKGHFEVALEAMRRAQPDNAPLTIDEQWVETASDNTDHVLAYADGVYCVTDAAGRVVCEFMRRKPEPEGGAADV